MSNMLRQFFESQPDCVVTAFFSDGNFPVRDIVAARPHLVIIQNTVINEVKRTTLQRFFPNTIIASWVDSRIDQARMNELVTIAKQKVITEFQFDRPDGQHRAGKQLSPIRFINNLTGKERQVLQLLAEGHTYPSVCGELLISYETLRTHVQHIYSKLGVKRVNEAVAKARKEKLVR